MSTSPRPIPTILAELAEIRRHLREAPPHHGAGVRERLDHRARVLERELETARRDAARRDDARRDDARRDDARRDDARRDDERRGGSRAARSHRPLRD